MPVHEIIPELAVLLTAVAVVLCASFLPRRRQGWCAAVAALGLGIALAAAAAQLGQDAHLTFSGTWAVDGVAVWAKLIILAVTLLVLLLCPEWFSRDRRHGELYAVLCFAALGALLMAGAADTMELVVGVLLSSVTGYTLAAYHRASAASVEAGMKFFLVGALANAVLLIGVAWLFGLSGTTDYRAMQAALAATGEHSAWLVAAALVVTGLTFKLGAVPGHAWMPDVAQGGPAPAAAFLTVVPKIGAAVAMARLGALFTAELSQWPLLIAVLATATMTFGNLCALLQTDLRRLLGWSSVSQSGYALVAVAFIGSGAGAAAALLYFLAAYAAANVAAFAAVTELRGRTALADYGGLAWQRPAVAIALTIALLSLVGIPPLAGFVGKLLLMLEAVAAGFAWLAAALVANTVLSLYYYLRVIGAMYFDKQTDDAPLLGRLAAAALWLSAGLVALLGLAANVLLEGLEHAAFAVH